MAESKASSSKKAPAEEAADAGALQDVEAKPTFDATVHEDAPEPKPVQKRTKGQKVATGRIMYKKKNGSYGVVQPGEALPEELNKTQITRLERLGVVE